MASRRAAIVGLSAVLFVLVWQAATVYRNYGGNWTALFRIGPQMPLPDYLQSEHLYIFQGTQGYDGQVYHLMAHDPWMRHGTVIPDAAFRYQRILVPALAWIVALGQDPWIHAAYYAVILGFVFLGTYWLALLASRPIWGLMFVLAPASIVSIDRMTADIALAALAAGFVLYVEQGSRWKTVAILACAALTRETALPIIAGYAIYLFTRRRFSEGSWAIAAVLPAGAWYLFLTRLTEPSRASSYLGWIPLAGFLDRVFHPVIYSLSTFKSAVALAFDYVALAGIAITVALAARMALARRWDAVAAAIYALALAAIFVDSRGMWEDANAFGRVLTPLLLLASIDSLRTRPWIAFLPILLVDARLSLDLWSQIAGLVK